MAPPPSLPIVSPKYLFPCSRSRRRRRGGEKNVLWGRRFVVVGCGAVLSWGRRRRATLPSSMLAAPSTLSSRIRPEGELEAQYGSNFSRPVKPVSKHANLSKDSHWLRPATPDHHCKQAARINNTFGAPSPAESPRFKHTASPRCQTSPSPSSVVNLHCNRIRAGTRMLTAAATAVAPR